MLQNYLVMIESYVVILTKEEITEGGRNMITKSELVVITPPLRVYSRLKNKLLSIYSALRPARVNAVCFARFVLMQYLPYFDDG